MRKLGQNGWPSQQLRVASDYRSPSLHLHCSARCRCVPQVFTSAAIVVVVPLLGTRPVLCPPRRELFLGGPLGPHLNFLKLLLSSFIGPLFVFSLHSFLGRHHLAFTASWT